jgi:hypothetical protein
MENFQSFNYHCPIYNYVLVSLGLITLRLEEVEVSHKDLILLDDGVLVLWVCQDALMSLIYNRMINQHI